jgi:hypothetical protein
LPTAWWNLYLALDWGNPVFPFLNNIFKSPYYQEEYWRDNRWVFESPIDFLSFLIGSAAGTSQTSELGFSDARFLLAFLLAGVAMVFFFRRIQMPRELSGMLVFFSLGFLVWALVFAYQRYFVPGELLMGLVVWILFSFVLKSTRDSTVALIAAVALSALLLSIPNWGHVRPNFSAGNPFSISIPEEVQQSPAVYFPTGDPPLSFVFPSLHRDSNFHSFGVSPAIDSRILEELRGDSRPIRTISLFDSQQAGVLLLTTLGLNADDVSCIAVESAISKLAICGEFKNEQYD